MMIAILTQDLMMSSSANAVARTQGKALKSIPSANKALQLIAEGECTMLLVDLQLPGLDLDVLQTGLAAIEPAGRPFCVAYAQHVEVNLIKQAKAVGFDEVLTRGQLNSGLDGLFSRVE